MAERVYQIYALKSPGSTLRDLGSALDGLSEEEAAARLQQHGPNEVKTKSLGLSDLIRRQFFSALTLLLLLAAVVAFVLGELADSLTLLVILAVNLGLSVFQEYRSALALRRLRTLVSAHSTLRRGGRAMEVKKEEIVIGDLVQLLPGDIVPADLRLIQAEGLSIDQSVLTGESAPTIKDADTVARAAAPAETANIAFAGTTVVGGTALGAAVATGRETEFGQIVQMVAETRKLGVFEESVRRFSVFLMKVVLALLAVIFFGKLIIEGGTARSGELLLFALALAVSVLPEALPAVVTLTFSRGALHLARKKVIVKRLSSIEDLGHVDVLCTDKTGTLTENRLEVADLYGRDRQRLARLAALSTAPESAGARATSSFDTALSQMAQEKFGAGGAPRRRVLVHQPYDQLRRWQLTLVAEEGASATSELIAKGGPEHILEVCVSEGGEPLAAGRRQEILAVFEEFGRAGNRVLAVAARPSATLEPAKDFDFVGLVAFRDPLKASARGAITLAEKLKVRVKILTGDSAAVAGAVAVEVGIIDDPRQVLSGPELERLSADELAAAAERYDVFARVTPEQKYRLIEVLERSHAVGFLGEGVNDAPALRLAHVALAVEGATDIARDASDVILRDRSLATIVDGIGEGRVIFANVAKYIRYTLSGNLGNMFSIAGISLVLPILPMLPVQLLLLNLLTDVPLLAVSADNVDPREVGEPRQLDIRQLAGFALMVGLVSSLFDFMFFGFFRAAAPAVLQTMWFIESALQELAVIFSLRAPGFFLRSAPPSKILLTLALLAAALTFLLPASRVGQEIFHFVPPVAAAGGLVAAIVAGSFAATELVKYWRSRIVVR